MRKTLSTLLVLGLVAGAFAAPADARRKRRKPAACKPPAAVADVGVGKPTVVVTDAATESAPISQTVTLDPSVADLTLGLTDGAADAFNVQVDSASPSAGLYVLFEFPTRRDYDLELLWPDSSYAARSHDFNLAYSPVPETYSNGGHAGEATDASEKIVGVRTPDCGSYTVEALNWLGEGGEMDIKVWLGEGKHDPQPPGAEPHA